MELSEKTLFQNQLQLQYFGYSATNVYTDYRVYVDQKLKFFLIDLSNLYEEIDNNTDMKPHLSEVYHTFWKLLEQPMRHFHEELQKTFQVPFEVVFPDLAAAGTTYKEADIQALRKDIETLEDDLLRKKCYMEHLKVLMKQLTPLKQCVEAATSHLKNLDSEHVEMQRVKDLVAKKRDEFVQELQKYKYTEVDGDKESEVMEEFRRMVDAADE